MCVHCCLIPYLQLGRIYLDMVNVYKVLSENISSAVSVSGELVVILYSPYIYNATMSISCIHTTH